LAPAAFCTCWNLFLLKLFFYTGNFFQHREQSNIGSCGFLHLCKKNFSKNKFQHLYPTPSTLHTAPKTLHLCLNPKP
jgi:hypothetical protein